MGHHGKGDAGRNQVEPDCPGAQCQHEQHRQEPRRAVTETIGIERAEPQRQRIKDQGGDGYQAIECDLRSLVDRPPVGQVGEYSDHEEHVGGEAQVADTTAQIGRQRQRSDRCRHDDRGETQQKAEVDALQAAYRGRQQQGRRDREGGTGESRDISYVDHFTYRSVVDPATPG